MNSHYVTVLSKYSNNYFPENKAGEFTNNLATPLDLSQGNWEVALSEIILPSDFKIIHKGDLWFHLYIAKQAGNKNDVRMHQVKLQPPYDPNIVSLLEYMNIQAKQALNGVHARLVFTLNEQKVQLRKSGLLLSVQFSPILKNILGFRSNKKRDGYYSFDVTERALYLPDVYFTVHSAFVYTSACEGSRLGSQISPLFEDSASCG